MELVSKIDINGDKIVDAVELAEQIIKNSDEAVEAGKDIVKGGEEAVKVANSAKPLGRGSTGRTTANTQVEADSMKKVIGNPQNGFDLSKKGLNMTDPRWPASEGWVKMTQNVDKVEIHYVYNKITGAVDDFKFK